MHRSIFCIMLAFIAVSNLIGCATLFSNNFNEDVNSYLEVQKKYTKELKVYNKFETVALVQATLFDDEWKLAYKKECDRVFGVTSVGNISNDNKDGVNNNIKSAIKWSPSDTNSDLWEIFVYIQSDEPKNSSLEKKDSIWNTYLITDSNEKIPPKDIILVKKISRIDEHFFPYVNIYGKVYKLVFPKKAPAKKVELLLTGVVGRAVILWDL